MEELIQCYGIDRKLEFYHVAATAAFDIRVFLSRVWMYSLIASDHRGDLLLRASHPRSEDLVRGRYLATVFENYDAKRDMFIKPQGQCVAKAQKLSWCAQYHDLFREHYRRFAEKEFRKKNLWNWHTRK